MRSPALPLLLSLAVSATVAAQNYSISNLPLPAVMNNQVCISGISYQNNTLYFASERCPVIFAADPATRTITGTINLKLPSTFEIEGLTSYKNKLYAVSENVAAVYEVNPADGATNTVNTSITLPPKSKNGDGMEGIAANEKNGKFYLLQERNEERTQALIYTFSIEPSSSGATISLRHESTISLPLLTEQWRYSDICYDAENNRLICLKSYAKGKLRQQYLESIDVDKDGHLSAASLKNIPVDNFSEVSNQYKDQDYSMNLEGITLGSMQTIYIASDNTSGKAQCDAPAKEKTILLEIRRK